MATLPNRAIIVYIGLGCLTLYFMSLSVTISQNCTNPFDFIKYFRQSQTNITLKLRKQNWISPEIERNSFELGKF